MHYFGPYKSFQRLQQELQEQVKEIIHTDGLLTEESVVDKVLERYRRLSTLSYSDYLLSSGREGKLIEDDVSEAYEYD
jgi:hypothetical protein